MEGDAVVKQLTGAQVMVMAEDVPALQAIKPGGKEHPIDKILHDGDTVTLGGMTLVAHLTAGHTADARPGRRRSRMAERLTTSSFSGSLRAGGAITPAIAAELDHSFAVVRKLACDVPLGDHPAQYGMIEKFGRLKTAVQIRFIDKANCLREADVQEAMYHAVVEEQKAGQP